MKKRVLGCCLVSLFVMMACEESSSTTTADPNDENVKEDDSKDEDSDASRFGEDDCTDECIENQRMCNDQGERVCGYFDSDPCLDWSEYSPCKDGCSGDVCQCVSECDELEAFKCDGKIGYMFCQDDDKDGCFTYSPMTFCGENQECDEAAKRCVPKSDGSVTCQDACNAGDKDCQGNGWRECKDTNADGCTEWTGATDCGDKSCNAGKCEDAAAACTNACDAGAKDCQGNGWRECKDTNGDGCTEWTGATDCGSGKKCDKGSCVSSCTNACENGKKQCKGAVVQTCSDSNGDGCTEWNNGENCQFGCDGGKCKADPNNWVPSCSGENCPIVVTDFSKTISGNTANGKNIISKYAGNCSATDESGPEQRYVFHVTEPGIVIIGTTEPKGGDVDVHLLKSLSADGCLARGDKGLSYHIDKGVYYVVADTYQSSANAGAHNLKITFLPDSGKCGLEVGTMARRNTPGSLPMPATGPVVQEAHMVTDHDQAVNGSNWWPNSFTQGLAEHKAYSAKWTGVNYGGDWCPSGEGGCTYGQGSTGKAVPWKAEAYYVCMYWKTKPSPGTRFLVVNPQTGKAVVAAAGYETGPGDGNMIGGAVYEIHQKLGTSHKSTLTFGQMKNQSLEYGPIDCN